jgi:hypothetical protein
MLIDLREAVKAGQTTPKSPVSLHKCQIRTGHFWYCTAT